MITLKEIAAELGVSVSTVSRVVTDKDRVDPEKRKLIKAALKKYNYIPNDSARGLRGMSSRSIGIIVPSLTSSFYNRIISAAWNVAFENEYTVVTSVGGGEKERDMARFFKNKQIGRIICASSLPDANRFYKDLFGENSVVMIDTEEKLSKGVGSISFDAFLSSKKLAGYVLGLGHTKILFLAHTSKHTRLEGFLDAAGEKGIEVEKEFIAPGLNSKTGYEFCKKMFSLPKDKRPTAVLATDNSLSYAAIRAARALNFSVPEDISVAGFDACDETGILTPEITCIMQDTKNIGKAAANMLISGKCEHITLEADFIKGSSCQKI